MVLTQTIMDFDDVIFQLVQMVSYTNMYTFRLNRLLFCLADYTMLDVNLNILKFSLSDLRNKQIANNIYKYVLHA
jgi:hypothetical protein